MARKDFLDLASLSRAEVEHLLEQAVPFKELFTRSVKKVPALKGKSVLMLFYEPSTRTLSSFEVAAKRLSADVTNFDVAQSSVAKGESVRETIETLQAMRTDYVIVRHKASGLPATIARLTRASVVNAGDGSHAHPTQAMLDMFTIRREKGPDFGRLRVAIVGDILHSRPVVFNYSNYSSAYEETCYEDAGGGDFNSSVIFVGANDGMLHAFDGGIWDRNRGSSAETYNEQHDLGDGSELFAYLPHAVARKLYNMTYGESQQYNAAAIVYIKVDVEITGPPQAGD